MSYISYIIITNNFQYFKIKGIYIIVKLKKNSKRKTEYKCKNYYSKKWVILERRADKPGIKFHLLQKVLEI